MPVSCRARRTDCLTSGLPGRLKCPPIQHGSPPRFTRNMVGHAKLMGKVRRHCLPLTRHWEMLKLNFHMRHCVFIQTCDQNRAVCGEVAQNSNTKSEPESLFPFFLAKQHGHFFFFFFFLDAFSCSHLPTRSFFAARMGTKLAITSSNAALSCSQPLSRRGNTGRDSPDLWKGSFCKAYHCCFCLQRHGKRKTH